MRKICIILISAAMALALAGCGAEKAGPAPEHTPPPRVLTAVPEPSPEPETLRLRLAADGDHPALMRCDGNGAFYPERTVSRRELCELLAPMLWDLPEPTAEFSDFHPGNAGYACAASLYDAGLIPSGEDGAFRPGDELTHAELAQILDRLSAALSGPAAERAADLAAETAAEASEPVRRAELAIILERLAGREPDEAALFLAECLPSDIALDDHAWGYIADAVTAGRIDSPAPGVHRAYGWLYATWEDGTLIRDMDVGVWTFGPDGRYTTGNEELDEALFRGLQDSGAAELTGREALEAAYLYVKYYGEYLIRPEDAEPLPPGSLGWEYDYARRFFHYGGGTCFGYSAAFGLMARALGETAYVVAAEVNQYYAAHAFVVIPEEGVDWIYDVQLEVTRPERHGDLDLFHIRNQTIYYYWYEPDWA